MANSTDTTDARARVRHDKKNNRINVGGAGWLFMGDFDHTQILVNAINAAIDAAYSQGVRDRAKLGNVCAARTAAIDEAIAVAKDWFFSDEHPQFIEELEQLKEKTDEPG